MLKQFAKWVLKRRLGKPTPSQGRLTEELRRRVAALPPLEAPSNSTALAEWIQNRKRLRELIAQDDPRRFLEWDVIRHTMFVGSARCIPPELAALRSSPDWGKRWRPALREDAVGLPERCRFDLRSSGNLIHHAYSLFSLEQAAGRTIDKFPFIIEFGGGYGSLCRLAHRLGFRGQYVIFDLPEFSALQQYFLESVGVSSSDSSSGSGVRYVSELSELNKIVAQSSDWLFIALWSLSETPVSLRRELLGDGSHLGAYLIAYQKQFGEVDNMEFFSDWKNGQKQMKWLSQPIPHLPGNHYLFGLGRNPR